MSQRQNPRQQQPQQQPQQNIDVVTLTQVMKGLGVENFAIPQFSCKFFSPPFEVEEEVLEPALTDEEILNYSAE